MDSSQWRAGHYYLPTPQAGNDEYFHRGQATGSFPTVAVPGQYGYYAESQSPVAHGPTTSGYDGYIAQGQTHANFNAVGTPGYDGYGAQSPPSGLFSPPVSLGPTAYGAQSPTEGPFSPASQQNPAIARLQGQPPPRSTTTRTRLNVNAQEFRPSSNLAYQSTPRPAAPHLPSVDEDAGSDDSFVSPKEPAGVPSTLCAEQRRLETEASSQATQGQPDEPKSDRPSSAPHVGDPQTSTSPSLQMGHNEGMMASPKDNHFPSSTLSYYPYQHGGFSGTIFSPVQVSAESGQPGNPFGDSSWVYTGHRGGGPQYIKGQQNTGYSRPNSAQAMGARPGQQWATRYPAVPGQVHTPGRAFQVGPSFAPHGSYSDIGAVRPPPSGPKHMTRNLERQQTQQDQKTNAGQGPMGDQSALPEVLFNQKASLVTLKDQKQLCDEHFNADAEEISNIMEQLQEQEHERSKPSAQTAEQKSQSTGNSQDVGVRSNRGAGPCERRTDIPASVNNNGWASWKHICEPKSTSPKNKLLAELCKDAPIEDGYYPPDPKIGVIGDGRPSKSRSVSNDKVKASGIDEPIGQPQPTDMDSASRSLLASKPNTPVVRCPPRGLTAPSDFSANIPQSTGSVSGHLRRGIEDLCLDEASAQTEKTGGMQGGNRSKGHAQVPSVVLTNASPEKAPVTTLSGGPGPTLTSALPLLDDPFVEQPGSSRKTGSNQPILSTPTFASFNQRPDFFPAVAPGFAYPTAPPPGLNPNRSIAPSTLSEGVQARGNWIHENATCIADATRAMAQAEARYRAHPSLANYQAWQVIKNDVIELTQLENVIRDRRELFMPEGAEAMRILGENGRGGFAGGGRGSLLGGEMAVLERAARGVGGPRGGRKTPGPRGRRFPG